MSFGRKSRRGLGAEAGAHGDDLLITPLLDLLTALVPFLIMSSVLLKINVVEVGLTKPVASNAATQTNGFDLAVKVSDRSAEVLLRGKVLKSVSRAGEGWIGEVRKTLVEIKKANPDEYKIRIEPSGNVTLDQLMVLMDAARNLKPEDGEITRKDEKGQTVKLQFLFPNVILRGVYG